MDLNIRKGFVIIDVAAGQILMAEFAEAAFLGPGDILQVFLELASNPETYEFRFLLILDGTRGVKIEFYLLHGLPFLHQKIVAPDLHKAVSEPAEYGNEIVYLLRLDELLNDHCFQMADGILFRVTIPLVGFQAVLAISHRYPPFTQKRPCNREGSRGAYLVYFPSSGQSRKRFKNR